jgi:hypothetical protein
MTQALTKPPVFDDVPARPGLVQPSKTLAEATHDLRRPFSVHAVQFRILEGRDGKRANCAAYIDAATAIDRLNLVVPGLWSDEFRPEQGGLACGLTIDGQTRWDVGTSSSPDQDMGFKGLRSDAFKRAAVKFGVGISLRTLPNLVLAAEQKPFPSGTLVRAIPKMRNGAPEQDKYGNPKFAYYLTSAGEAELRRRYTEWLAGPGRHFGEPLDHGHVAGSRDVEDQAPREDDKVATEPPRVIVLSPEAQLVLDHASKVGHAQLSDPQTVAMMVEGMTPESLAQWASDAHKELNDLDQNKQYAKRSGLSEPEA